jgi:hypothetical protein
MTSGGAFLIRSLAWVVGGAVGRSGACGWKMRWYSIVWGSIRFCEELIRVLTCSVVGVYLSLFLSMWSSVFQ